jgi:predicted DNA-binding transcriptional regulator AlpA
MEYEFTLKYQLVESDANLDELVERLGAGGCDDALIGIGQPGRIGLKFTREAMSAKEALKSAMADVRRVIPSARLIEAGPDFVGLTDAAELVGMSRQNLRKLMMAHAASFPIPVHEGSAGVWHLADVLNWLQEREYLVDQGVVEVSQTTRQINVAKEVLQVPADTQQELAALVA